MKSLRSPYLSGGVTGALKTYYEPVHILAIQISMLSHSEFLGCEKVDRDRVSMLMEEA